MAELSTEVATFVEWQLAWGRTIAWVCAGVAGAVTGTVIVCTVRLIRQACRPQPSPPSDRHSFMAGK